MWEGAVRWPWYGEVWEGAVRWPWYGEAESSLYGRFLGDVCVGTPADSSVSLNMASMFSLKHFEQ